MRLRSIHIKGFKSFPLDTTIHFNERVTGVVGPNGSGKSNIVDAIRWVLGEQKTSELRLGAMSDVLFNGTKKRKKSGLAQVTLHFDNTKNLIPTDYNQVAISRLLYRSGESEYRINDVPCRLKDVRGLFADTGVGSDSYAIIALNMVDDLLTDSDGSRRRMFEQASGISKYKKRKHETLNKLKNTNADLDRVEDLLFEIQNNLQELEKQARRVERFLKIKDQYKNISIQLNLRQFDEISINKKKIQDGITDETDKHRAGETRLRALESNLQEAKKGIISNEQELSSFQREINQLLDEVRKMESDKQLSRQQIEFNQQKIKTLHSDLKDLEIQIDQLQLKFQNVGKKLEGEKKIKDQLKGSYELALKEYEGAKNQYELLKADHDALAQEKQKLEVERFQIEKKIAVSENQIDRITQLSSRNSGQIELLKTEKLQFKQVKSESQKELSTLTGKLEVLLESSTNRKLRLKEFEDNRNQLRMEKEKLSRKLDARVNEYDLVKSMLDSLEGFPESIKYLNKSWKAGAILLTDLIYAPDEFKLAIESYLEPYLNYYVVEDQEDAYDAIALLHGAQKGKANFFVLDRIEGKTPVTFENDGMIRALDVLEYDEKYFSLLAKLLHNVFITDLDVRDIDIFSEDRSNSGFTIIDKKGSFIASEHSISGGSVGLFEGKKLGRKKNLEKLQQEIQSLQNKNRKLDTKLIQFTDDINKLEMESDDQFIEQTRKSIEDIKIVLLEHEMKEGNIEKQLINLNSELEQQKAEKTKLIEVIDESRLSISNIKKKMDSLFQGREQDDTSLQSYSDALSRASEAKNNCNIELIRHQNLTDGLESELSYTSNDLDKAKSQFKNSEKSISELKIKVIEQEDALNNLEKSLVEKYEIKREMETRLSGVEKAFYEERAKITELEESISTVRRSIHQSQFLINELKEKLHDQEFRMQSVSERLKIEFNMVIDELQDIERTEIPLHDLEEKHDRLKRKIENFGEINTLAIEAYNEMKLRFETIEQQKADIVQSQENLLKTIEEIETIATERYRETFAVVKEYFKDVFTSLFNEGDTCDIVMEDPERPLESKIEIIAKPKGKRPKTLNQLSGGEKTLTAIALLFSLYLYKPAPFCIFDEVDAPLDDANIEKFNRIVKKFSKDSQFIIVTHNKATMAAVDVLYGVFMQEMGVSEVAAVDFRAYEPVTPVLHPN